MNTKLKKFRLEIAIPTFKRPHYLQRCLESIAASSNNILEQVLITVYDNDYENQNAHPVIKEFLKKIPNIRSIENLENSGPAINVLRCGKYSVAEYLYIIGDDDWFTTDGVSSLLAYATSSDSDVFFLNYRYSYPDGSTSNPVLPILKQNINLINYLKNYSFQIGFIGSILIKSDVWRHYVDILKHPRYPHFQLILILLSEDFTFSVKNDVVLNNFIPDYSNHLWIYDYINICYSLEDLVLSYISIVNKNNINYIYKNIKKHGSHYRLDTLLLLRNNNLLDGNGRRLFFDIPFTFLFVKYAPISIVQFFINLKSVIKGIVNVK